MSSFLKLAGMFLMQTARVIQIGGLIVAVVASRRRIARR